MAETREVESPDMAGLRRLLGDPRLRVAAKAYWQERRLFRATIRKEGPNHPLTKKHIKGMGEARAILLAGGVGMSVIELIGPTWDDTVNAGITTPQRCD